MSEPQPKTLVEKLGFAPGDSVYVETTPGWYTDFADQHELELEAGLPATHAHIFCANKAELADFLRENNLAQAEKSVWISWPKKDSKQRTDLGENDIRDALLPLGWVDTKVASIDGDWSGLKFVRRKTAERGAMSVPAIIAVAIIAIVLAAAVFLLLNRNHSAAKSTNQSALAGYCVGQTFATGSSGHCVSDIQTLTNYMENSGLTECPFKDGATLSVDGTYTTATATQISAVQQWSQCYAKQEGFSSNVQQTGSVDKSTWGELCTYSYTDPLHTSASDSSDSIAAGKDAGCAQLHA